MDQRHVDLAPRNLLDPGLGSSSHQPLKMVHQSSRPRSLSAPLPTPILPIANTSQLPTFGTAAQEPLRNILAHLHREKTALSTENAELKSRLAAMQACVDAVQPLMRGLDGSDPTKALQAMIEHQQAKVKMLLEENKQLEREKYELVVEKKSSGLEWEVSWLEARNVKMMAQCRAQKAKVRRLKVRNDRQRAEIRRLRAALEWAEERLERVVGVMRGLAVGWELGGEMLERHGLMRRFRRMMRARRYL